MKEANERNDMNIKNTETLTLSEGYELDRSSLGDEFYEHIKEHFLENEDDAQKKPLSKKLMPFNVNIYKNDLIFIKHLIANTDITSRSALLKEMLEEDIRRTFDEMPQDSRHDAALITDHVMNQRGYQADFRGLSWTWDVVDIDFSLTNSDILASLKAAGEDIANVDLKKGEVK